MSEHMLKIQQQPYIDLCDGVKTGEVRDCSDRDFQVGDIVILNLINQQGQYTGHFQRRKITHVQRGFGLPDNLCVLSYDGVISAQPNDQELLEQQKVNALKSENEILRKKIKGLEALLNDIDNWLVCAAIATPEDMAQSFEHFQQRITDELADIRGQKSLAAISAEEKALLAGVATGLGLSYDDMAKQMVGVVPNPVDARYKDLALELTGVSTKLRAVELANEILRNKLKELEALPTSLPDNLISHRRAWLSALERVCELEPESTIGSEEDTRGYWKHELAAMHDMYADLDRKMAEPYPFIEPLSLTSARGIPLRLEFDPADGQSMWLEGGCRTGESEEDFIRIDTIENAEFIAQHLLGWVRAERSPRVTELPAVSEKE